MCISSFIFIILPQFFFNNVDFCTKQSIWYLLNCPYISLSMHYATTATADKETCTRDCLKEAKPAKTGSLIFLLPGAYVPREATERFRMSLVRGKYCDLKMHWKFC